MQNEIEVDLIDFIFPGRVDDIENINSTIVSPYILDTIDIAQRVLDRLPGEQITKTGIDDIHNRNPDDAEDIQNFPIEQFHTLTPSGMPPYELNIKVGCLVMLFLSILISEKILN